MISRKQWPDHPLNAMPADARESLPGRAFLESVIARHIPAGMDATSEAPTPPPWRWCVDEPADFALVSRLLEALLPESPTFTWRDCDALMRQHPQWAQLNQHVRQKGEKW
jgi:hypothetical protein